MATTWKRLKIDGAVVALTLGENRVEWSGQRGAGGSIPLANITAVSTDKAGLAWSAVTIHHSGGPTVVQVPRRQAGEVRDAIAQAMP